MLLRRVQKRRKANARYRVQKQFAKQCPFGKGTGAACPWQAEAWDFPVFESTKKYMDKAPFGCPVAPNNCKRCGRQVAG